MVRLLICLALAASARAQAPVVLLSLTSPDPIPNGGFGYEVARLGDLNSDGIPEFLVTGDRRAYVLDGTDGTLVQALTPTTGVSFFAASGIGDIDSDGINDVLMSNVGATPEPPHSGRVHAFSGATGAHLYTLAGPSSLEGGFFGVALDRAADVDADGIADFIVGATGEGPNSEGRAHVFSGATGNLICSIDNPSPHSAGGGDLGRGVSGIGDVDGDGYGDLVVSTLGSFSDPGRVYVVSGIDCSLIYFIESENQHDSFGFGLALQAMSDIDGDDIKDIVVGTWGEDYEGHVYVYSGSTGGRLYSLSSPRSVDEGNFGRAVDRAGDVDGDGVEDFVVGAPFERGPFNESGRAYVFSGATGGVLMSLQSPNAEPDGQFGYSVAGVGDLNGDGRSDVLVGAGGEGDYGVGRAYVFSLPAPVAAEPSPYDGYALSVTPNPAREDATVSLMLRTAAEARVAAFDGLGREVALLHDGPLAAGTHRLALDTSCLSLGVYVIRAVAGGYAGTRRISVVR